MEEDDWIDDGEPSPVSADANLKPWRKINAKGEIKEPCLPCLSDEGLRHDAADRRRILQSIDDYYPRSAWAAGSLRCDTTREDCVLRLLPSELILNILSYLSPLDLNSVSQTCHALYAHATSEHIWQALVQSNVPGVTVSSPYPCSSFRELYAAHDPRWFLTKHKIWFSGRGLTGKLILVRYDERRGCIEGYQMLAISNREAHEVWSADDQVVIHNFEPQVKLHLDKPILRLRAHSLENLIRAKMQGCPSTWPTVSGAAGPAGPQTECQTSRFACETPMILDDAAADTMFSNFIFSRPVPASEELEVAALYDSFPYGNLWPPPDVPSRHRVRSANFQQGCVALGNVDRPTSRNEVSDLAFHIRTWMEMRHGSLLPFHRILSPQETGDVGGRFLGLGQAALPWGQSLFQGPSFGMGQHIGEEVTTYTTLDPKLYTPTPDKPWRGIWVGDYSGHGCEFLLIHQEDSEPFDESTLEQKPDETPQEFEQRKSDARIYRGRLDAIKLTGDPNVPRGEYTFVVDDLGEGGFVTVVREPPFTGARVVESRGHVAGTGFMNDRYIESQLMLISHDRLAQYWVGFGHISFFERVDIDQFLKP